MNIDRLYAEIAPRLLNWLVATGSSHADASDLVQDAFAKIWSMKGDLRDDDAAVSGLAFTIARNLRKNKARDDRRLVFTDQLSESAAVTQPPHAAESDLGYLRERLQTAFAQLPPPLREAYTLFQIGELSIREIAVQTGASENLVKVRIFRAKEKLRKILEDLRVTF